MKSKKLIVLMSLLFLFSIQGVFADSIEQESTENSNGNITVQSIPGTTKKVFTRTETEQVNQYTDTENRTTSETINVTGATLQELNGSIEAAIKGVSGSGVTATVGGKVQTSNGWSATVTISRTHTLKVQHTVYHVYKVTYETLTDIESGQSYTYEKSRSFVRSYVETIYI